MVSGKGHADYWLHVSFGNLSPGDIIYVNRSGLHEDDIGSAFVVTSAGAVQPPLRAP
ncbi:MAG: hypothetical protein HY367_00330 [Candidatus Aenigmarchaeota archaeon]|nr:hypothetical protein [Candidatus Aenigmarchaeota archaeon]